MSELWVEKSARGREFFMGFGLLLLGFFFLWKTWDVRNISDNYYAAFLLGWMLFGLGLFSVLFAREQKITIDAVGKKIEIENKTKFSNSVQVIRFAEIKEIGIGRIGSHANFTNFYHLRLHLKNGKVIPLFVGMYEDVMDRNALQNKKEKLEMLIFGASS